MKKLSLTLICFILLSFALYSQTFSLLDGDTVNLTLANGMKQGFWRYTWPDGDLKYEVYYENGEKDALEIKYYDAQDCLEYSNTYRKGVLDGPSVSFFPSCSTRCEEIYKDGLKSGYERCYDENSYLQTEGRFEKGELAGSYAHFDKKGYVTYESPTKETTLKFDKFLTGEYKVKDSTIFNTFKRNPNWKKILLVVDMTGSMFPYIGQLLVWYKQTYEEGRVKYYVLFNDGDNVLDSKKPVGNAGGVHPFDAKDFRKLKKDIEDVRKLGEGGDDPENDLEAVYKSMGTLRDYGDIVLLADDSPVRDMALLKRIKKPVHVVLCGTAKGVNTEYLKIAYQTKGSISTWNETIQMKGFRENQTLTVDNDIFRLSSGEFIWLDTKGGK